MRAHLRAVPEAAPRAVLYLRQSVSRDDSVSLELQELAGRDYCATQGYTVVAVERDEGLTGRNWSRRPAVQRALTMIEAREADVIVLWKWSRLSRNRKDWAVAADQIDVAGGRIESATEPIDTSKASGRFARGVMTEYAAFQSEQIGEQWNEVHAHRFERGLPPTGTLPWGWESKRDHIETTEEASNIVAEMYRRYLSGQGTSGIASWLNSLGIPAKRSRTWRHRSVITCLESPIHAGLITYRGETRKGAHDAIISEATWAQYQRARERRTRVRQPRSSDYLLTGVLFCHCGEKRFGSTVTKTLTSGPAKYTSYVCRSNHTVKAMACWRVNAAVSSWVKALDADASPEPPASVRADRELAAREVLAIDRQLDDLTRHLLSGLVPEASFKRTRDELLAEREVRQNVLDEQEHQSIAPARDYIAGQREAIECWDTLDVPAKRETVKSLVERITFEADGTMSIRAVWGEDFGPFDLRAMKRP